MSVEQLKLEGVGVGLRACHYTYIEETKPEVNWFEVLTDNYLCEDSLALDHLNKIRASYPITLHGVGMSLGSTDPLNQTYLKKLKSLIQMTQPLLVSDHLSWSSFNGNYFHELLPLPYTEEAIIHVVQRIKQVQDYLEQKIMIENVSSYLSFNHSVLSEWEFLTAIAVESQCLILLDVNNIYVSANNNKFNPMSYINGLTTPIAQFHLGGFEDKGTHLLDTHSAAIHSPVWELFEKALQKWGPLPACIEWDNEIPDFNTLQQQAKKAQELMEKVC